MALVDDVLSAANQINERAGILGMTGTDADKVRLTIRILQQAVEFEKPEHKSNDD